MSKYNAKKAKRGNLTFDSQAEARRYDELLLLLRAGQIRNLQLQKTYCLQEPFTGIDGERVRGIDYVCDFYYERKTSPDQNGQVYWLSTIEDVKGYRNPSDAAYRVFTMKKKLMQSRYGISIVEISNRGAK